MRLLKLAQVIYGYIRGAQPSVVYREFLYRIKGEPNKIPLPPSQLIFLVTGGVRWVSTFLDSGELTVTNMISILKKNGFDIGGFDSILDFGCGCGRLIRHLRFLEKPKIYGTDLNNDLICWCKRYLDFAQFDTNNLYPPLEYADEKFDFIFARSVFTHLNEELQLKWVAEMWRVLRPGGVLYFTTQAEQYTHSLTDAQRRQFKAGKLVVVNPELTGQNACMAYHPREFVEERLLDGFVLVDFILGEDRAYCRHDIYIVRKL